MKHKVYTSNLHKPFRPADFSDGATADWKRTKLPDADAIGSRDVLYPLRRRGHSPARAGRGDAGMTGGGITKAAREELHGG